MKLFLKKYRDEAGLTQQMLADATGIPLKTIQDWEQTGRSPRNMYRLCPVADALGCSIDQLLGHRPPHPPDAILPRPVETVPAPAYKCIPAGARIEMIEMDYLDESITRHEKHQNAYFLLVSDGGIDREILPGHYALIDPDSMINSGDIVAVNIGDDDAVLRVYYKTPNSIVLAPNSSDPSFEDILITDDDPDAIKIRILGKKVWAKYPEI